MGCRSPHTAEELGLLLPAAGGEQDGGPGNDHCIETCGNFLPVRRADRVTCMPDATRLTHHMVFTRLYTPTISPFPGHMGPLVAGVVKPVVYSSAATSCFPHQLKHSHQVKRRTPLLDVLSNVKSYISKLLYFLNTLKTVFSRHLVIRRYQRMT